MVRNIAVAVTAIAAVSGCSHPAPKAEKPNITQFKANPAVLAAGISGKLCYGVENAARLELTPRVEDILPASERCIDIAPKATTVYTLTAFGADPAAGQDMKQVEVKVGPPPPRISDLKANSTQVRRGAMVRVCFKVQNAKSVDGKPGKLNRRTNCLTDYPKKTTTYRINAHGGDKEEDSGTVTVKVGP
ncbi:MAG TPA: hypothetical protein VG297_00545 [Bryobacteraceae bacterium]|jgi:hypothetical protein|nr:hypothetical protein [Bryobacteraceae bacterium]